MGLNTKLIAILVIAFGHLEALWCYVSTLQSAP